MNLNDTSSLILIIWLENCILKMDLVRVCRWVVVGFCKHPKFCWKSFDVVLNLLDVSKCTLFDAVQIARWIHSLKRHIQGWFALCPMVFHALQFLNPPFYFGLLVYRFITFLVRCIEWFELTSLDEIHLLKLLTHLHIISALIAPCCFFHIVMNIRLVIFVWLVGINDDISINTTLTSWVALTKSKSRPVPIVFLTSEVWNIGSTFPDWEYYHWVR